MNIKKIILRTENEFPKIFASYFEKDYGILFYDDNNKQSYDSNHATVYSENITDIKYVLSDIKDFYLRKDITPRIYMPFTTGYFEKHKDILESLGYEIDHYGTSRFMLLMDENNIHVEKELVIKRVTQWEEHIANDIFIPNKEEYEIDTIKNSFKNKDFYLFVGYLGDIAVTTIYFHLSEYGCTRFDYIATAKNYRNKGYARELLSFVVDYCKDNNIINCYQWPAHKTSEKICYEAGFRVIFEVEAGSAVYHDIHITNK